MAIDLPIPPDDLQDNKHAANCFNSLTTLLQRANQKDVPASTQESINKLVGMLNSNRNNIKEWYKQLRRTQQKTVFILSKEAKLTPLNFYRNQWMAVGMGAFGVPIGLSLGLSLGNIGLLGLGLPLGLAIGLALGTSMDKKAMDEGRQLNVELKTR